jgi:hypothetical protein
MLIRLAILMIGHRRIDYSSRIEDVEEQAFDQIEKYQGAGMKQAAACLDSVPDDLRAVANAM